MDITERKRAEEALRVSTERYRDLVERMNEGLAVIDENARITFANPRFCGMLKYSEGEVIGSEAASFFDEENRQVLGKELTKRRWGESTQYEITFTAKTGEKIPTLMSAAPIFEGGIHRGSYTVITDLTECKRAEEALRESEEKYSTIVEGGNDGVVIVKDLRFVFANQKIADLTGYAIDEINNLETEKVVTLKYLQMALERYHRRMVGEYMPVAYNIEIIRKDGRKIPVELNNARIEYQGGPADVIFIRDITERKEEALRESEERYRNILESIEDGYFEVDLAGKFTFFNDSLCRIMGYSRDEMVGMSYRTYTVGKDAENLYKTSNQVYRTGKPVEGFAWEVVRKDGDKRFLEVSISLVRNSVGEIVGFRGLARDITERKQAEEEREALLKDLGKINSKLEQSNKELQDFAYVASHDLREPLRKITSFSTLLQDSLEGKLDEDQQENFEFMIDGAKRMQEMIDDLLSYSRVTTQSQATRTSGFE